MHSGNNLRLFGIETEMNPLSANTKIAKLDYNCYSKTIRYVSSIQLVLHLRCYVYLVTCVIMLYCDGTVVAGAMPFYSERKNI